MEPRSIPRSLVLLFCLLHQWGKTSSLFWQYTSICVLIAFQISTKSFLGKGQCLTPRFEVPSTNTFKGYCDFLHHNLWYNSNTIIRLWKVTSPKLPFAKGETVPSFGKGRYIKELGVISSHRHSGKGQTAVSSTLEGTERRIFLGLDRPNCNSKFLNQL